MENSTKKNWLYGVIVLLLLVLVIETGLLISRRALESPRKERGKPFIQRHSDVSSPRLYSSPRRPPKQPFSVPDLSEDWDPFQEIRKMQEEMNRLFDESFGRATRTSGLWGPAAGFSHAFQFPSFSPAIDLEETKDAYTAKVDLPGLEKDKIEVSVSGNVLTIQGERKVETEKEDARQGFYASERSYGSFSRSVTLPGPVDESRIWADYQNGVLTITLPKLKGAESREKKVAIT